MFMLGTIMKNLFTGYSTRLHPAKKREPFPTVKGWLKIDIETCTFCTLCQIRCPSQCIQVDRKEKAWHLDPFSCVYCGICVEVCPVNCLSQDPQYRPAVFSKSDDHYQQPPRGAVSDSVPPEAACAPRTDAPQTAAGKAAPQAGKPPIPEEK